MTRVIVVRYSCDALHCSEGCFLWLIVVCMGFENIASTQQKSTYPCSQLLRLCDLRQIWHTHTHTHTVLHSMQCDKASPFRDQDPTLHANTQKPRSLDRSLCECVRKDLHATYMCICHFRICKTRLDKDASEIYISPVLSNLSFCHHSSTYHGKSHHILPEGGTSRQIINPFHCRAQNAI